MNWILVNCLLEVLEVSIFVEKRRGASWQGQSFEPRS